MMQSPTCIPAADTQGSAPRRPVAPLWNKGTRI